MQKIVMLDQALLTNSGVFEFCDLPDHEVKEMVQFATLESRLRFPSVANVISKHLGVSLMVNKEQYSFLPGDIAIVFVLNGNKGLLNLNSENIRKAGFTFKFLRRSR